MERLLRNQKYCPTPHASHTTHAIFSGVPNALSTSITSVMVLLHPGKRLVRRQRIPRQQGLEDRRLDTFQSHRLPECLIHVRTILALDDENDDDATLIRGLLESLRRHVMTDVQLANRNRLVERLTHPHRDALGTTGRASLFTFAAGLASQARHVLLGTR